MDIKEKARKLKKEIPAIFIALKDKDTPVTAKIFAALTVAYALSPIDLIPDFIPVLGYLDDIVILPILATVTIKLIPKDIWEKSKIKSEHLWDGGKPKKWYFALPIILIWILAAVLIIRALCRAI
ncbi:MAG: DUF1232 domain-containing protein [Clostridia bacterium]|nr:DUF1232 domain-containing protein [Clostridia bacterium]